MRCDKQLSLVGYTYHHSIIPIHAKPALKSDIIVDLYPNDVDIPGQALICTDHYIGIPTRVDDHASSS